MEEKLYQICHFCSDVVVEGCESMTESQVNDWLNENQQPLEEESPCGDKQKYVVLLLNKEIYENITE